MAKKKRPSRLPDLADIDNKLREVQNEKTPVEKYGRPPDPEKQQRVKFTTMLKPDLRDTLKKTAIDRGITAADLLDEILRTYFK